MKTEITKFCETYRNVLNTLPPALKTATDALEKSDAQDLLKHPLDVLHDVRARLRTLVDKIESQQAYLLIFGPLKSGKSTLMNAISRSYVSEVTSLPGYPCLVYVRHADEPSFSATRYNGRETVFANGQILKDVIADSHIALAEQIRVADERGTSFDPRHDFSEAIRRIDVRVPVANLAESSTVLVDTPGLYSRMNFGYDVLTREFRDSAACAVFVVKTDNLYLEQVFAEFNQLLGLFSRIFLVINVDSSKRDLQPDGTLQPSAESRDPQQIIEAFKTLSMAGPLRQAYQEGRLRIHAVDLLNAASAFLAPSTHETNGTNGNNATNGNSVTEDPHPKAFDTFLTDLTDYLNSNDYTQEFMRDSLRQGTNLCGEMREVYAGPELQQLAEKHTALGEELNSLGDKIATIDRLLGVDWEASLEQARAEATKDAERAAIDRAQSLVPELTAALNEWYKTDASLQSLVEQSWNPILTRAAAELASETRSRLHRVFGGTLGGAEPAAATMTDLHAIDFQLFPIGQAASSTLDTTEPTDHYRAALKSDDLPVKKSFGDWILFRGLGTVRRRLFGEALDQPITPEQKQKRLPEHSRAALERQLQDTVKEKFPTLPAKYSDILAAAYVAKFRTTTLEHLRKQKGFFGTAHAASQAPYNTISAILEAMKALDEQSSKTVADILVMAQQETGLPLNPAAAPEGELATSASLADRSAA